MCELFGFGNWKKNFDEPILKGVIVKPDLEEEYLAFGGPLSIQPW